MAIAELLRLALAKKTPRGTIALELRRLAGYSKQSNGLLAEAENVEFVFLARHLNGPSPMGPPAQEAADGEPREPATTASEAENPPQGWQFSPGKAVYKGTEIFVNGIRWKLLKALAESKQPLTEAELIEAAWGHDSDKESKTLQNNLSKIRKILRGKLRLNDRKPIPVVDRGKNRAWLMADFLR